MACRRRLSPKNEKLLWYVKDPYRYVFDLDAIRDPDDHDVRVFGSPREIDSVSSKLIEVLCPAISTERLTGGW